MKHFSQLILVMVLVCICSGCNLARDPEIFPPTATPFEVPAASSPVVPLPIVVRLPVTPEMARQVDSFWSFTEYVDMQTPGEQVYEVTIPAQTMRQSFSWCADTAERLTEILGQVGVGFFIDGIQIDPALILETDEGICHQWDTILEGWTVGQTVEATIVYNIATPIFDGALDYAAGSYVQRIIVTVQ